MIEDVRFGAMTVAGEVHRKDLVVFAPGLKGEGEVVAGGWWRREGHALHPEDLEEVVRARPRVLVVGCGAHGALRVPRETVAWLARHGIEARICPTTREGARRYNELLAAGEAVAGAFHLTC